MERLLLSSLFALFCLVPLFAETAADRTQSAATVLNEIMSTPDKGIPEEILGSAKCIAVVPSLLKGGLGFGGAYGRQLLPGHKPRQSLSLPSLLKGGLGFGGAYGRGVAVCRTADGWSAPAPFV